MQRAELATDVSQGNILYHPEHGFTVLDYTINPRQTLTEKVLTFASRDVLLSYSVEGDVPHFAKRFMRLCAAVLGRSIAHEVTNALEAEAAHLATAYSQICPEKVAAFHAAPRGKRARPN